MKMIIDALLFIVCLVLWAVVAAAILLLLPSSVRRHIMYLGVRVIRWVSPAMAKASLWMMKSSDRALLEARAAARLQKKQGKIHPITKVG